MTAPNCSAILSSDEQGNVTLNTEEQRRLMILNQLGSGSLSSAEAAALVGLSERQVRRLRRAYEARGASALAHGKSSTEPVRMPASCAYPPNGCTKSRW